MTAQTERNQTLFEIAEVQPVFCKNSTVPLEGAVLYRSAARRKKSMRLLT